VKIIAGAWRGRPLEAPPGLSTRPTNARAREALFSMLASRLGSFEELSVADLFAGSGALGLEALSRGAAHCTFVERDPGAVKALRANIARLGATARATVLAQNVETLARGRPHDLLLLDPPYGSGASGNALSRLSGSGWISPGAWISVETGPGENALPAGFIVDAVREHGKARLTLLRPMPQSPDQPAASISA
jgi:16S rRNA (guanine966-N2)-methyltransferase